MNKDDEIFYNPDKAGEIFTKPHIVNYETVHLKGDLFHYDKPFCGRVYDKNAMKRAINKFRKQLKMGELNHKPMFGSFNKDAKTIEDFVGTAFDVGLEHVSHRINDVYNKGDKAYVDLDILNTPAGDDIKKLLDAGMKLHASPELIVNGDKVIELVSIGLYPDTINNQNLPPLEKV